MSQDGYDWLRALRDDLIDPPESVDESMDPACTKSDTWAECVTKIQDMCARRGRLNGHRCVIESTDRAAFFLRGFPDGNYRLVKTWSEAGDESDEQGRFVRMQFELKQEPSGGPETGVTKHRIVGMRFAAQADRFFRWDWGVEPIDAPTSALEVTPGDLRD